jgi:hypothetical protein
MRINRLKVLGKNFIENVVNVVASCLTSHVELRSNRGRRRSSPMRALDEFKRDIVAYLPSLLVLFDLADAKRRNCHLGFRVVDRDIDELDRQVRISTGASGLAKRVGWKSTGNKDGQIKVAERTVPAKLVRSVRCTYSFTASQRTSDLMGKLLEHNYGLPPGTPLALSEVANMKRSRWECVTNYPSESPSCPFCEGRVSTMMTGISAFTRSRVPARSVEHLSIPEGLNTSVKLRSKLPRTIHRCRMVGPPVFAISLVSWFRARDS